MPNWFNKTVDPSERIRYRAVIPVDIWISGTGDPMVDQEAAYDKIKEILNSGNQAVETEGFSDLLQINDVQKHSDGISF